MGIGAERISIDPTEQSIDDLARSVQATTSALNGVASMAIEGRNGRHNGLTDEQILARLRVAGAQAFEAAAWLENRLHRRIAMATGDNAPAVEPVDERRTFSISEVTVNTLSHTA